jgi:DNA-nicking Smr family endonuclease
MSKKNSIDDDEKALFQQAVQGTQPLSREKRRAPAKKAQDPAAAYRRQQASEDKIVHHPTDLTHAALGAEDSVFFAAVGMQKKQIKRLKQGDYIWEATLDLHGLNLMEAEIRLLAFLEDCYQQQHRYLRIIHGKGARSTEGKPLMKNLAILLVQQSPHLLAMSSAIPRDGGNGALYVVLKRF